MGNGELVTLEAQLRQSNSDSVAMLGEVVMPEHICDVVSRWTGIPVARLSRTEKQRLLGLGERLGSRVLGQQAAVHAVADAMLRSRAGLSRVGQPMGSFL